MEIIFLIDVVTAIVAILIMVFLLQVPTHEKAIQEQVSNYFQDMKFGFLYIKNHTFIKKLFLYFSMDLSDGCTGILPVCRCRWHARSVRMFGG